MKNKDQETIIQNVKGITKSIAEKMASEAKLSAKKLSDYVQEKQDAESKRIAFLNQQAMQQRIEYNKQIVRELAATALNQMPQSKQLFGELSQYSLHVKALTDREMLVCLSANHLQEEKSGNLRSFCRSFQETVFNLHLRALSNLQNRIEEDREILRSQILDAQNRIFATSETPQYDFQRYIDTEIHQACNRYLSLYNRHIPFLHYVENVTANISAEFELTFEMVFDDKGLHPTNYTWLLNQ